MSIISDWNNKQKELRNTIKSEKDFNRAKELFLELHSLVHNKEISDQDQDTYLDQLYMQITDTNYAIMPTKKDVTIAWNLWHITRIEDITVNILLQSSDQVLNDEWLKKLGINVCDTGNAMTDEEIMDLSKNIHMETLQLYRKEVGKQTRRYLKTLQYQDMKRKMNVLDISKIQQVGGLTTHPDSIWLAEFWGKKDVAGIILMPITRHQIGHINDSFRLVSKVSKAKEVYY